jgi:hypothetical protein
MLLVSSPKSTRFKETDYKFVARIVFLIKSYRYFIIKVSKYRVAVMESKMASHWLHRRRIHMWRLSSSSHWNYYPSYKYHDAMQVYSNVFNNDFPTD